MQPKTLMKLILVFVLLVVASQPIGQISVDVGNFLVSVGHNLQNFNISGHP